jgi:hypothetical protein
MEPSFSIWRYFCDMIPIRQPLESMTGEPLYPGILLFYASVFGFPEKYTVTYALRGRKTRVTTDL